MKRPLLKSLVKAPPEAQPFHMISGLGGHVLEFRPMASALLPAWHGNGVLYPLYAGGPGTCASIEGLASTMADALVDVEDPLIIAGYSFGGTVAYEMACQLRDRNRQVAVILMDTSVRALRRKRGRLFRGFRNIFLIWPMRILGIEKPPPLTYRDPKDDRATAFMQQCRKAGRVYRPAKSDVPVVLIRATARDRYKWVWGRFWPSRDYGWSNVAPVAAILKTKGNHATLMDPENRDELVVAMNKALRCAYDRIAKQPG